MPPDGIDLRLGAGIFMGFEANKIGRDVSWGVIALIGVLSLISIALLFTTAFMDPGFVPRDPEDEVERGCGRV